MGGRDLVAEAALAAGVKRWWGDGPRPLNVPGSAPSAIDYTRRWPAEPELVRTIVLEPTPAQLAAGVRVIEIGADEAYNSIATLYDTAVGRGWAAQIAQSRYLSTPMTSGDLARRGRRLERVVQSLRVQRGPVRAYGVWEFDVERSKWAPQGGRVGLMTAQGLMGIVDLNVTQLEKLIRGASEE